MFRGKAVVITGAGGGIGGAVARAFAEQGARLILADRDEAGLARISTICRDAGSPEVITQKSDATSEDDVNGLLKRADGDFGRVDVLVNSSGVISERSLEEMPLAEWRSVMTGNLEAVFLACRAAVPIMRRGGGGRIINIASQIGQRGAPRFAHYAAAKAGVIALTKSLAREVARDGILVNAVAPGPVVTSFNAGLDPNTLRETANQLPLGRPAQPEEIAGAVILLASYPGGNVFVGQSMCPNSGVVML
jgi:3-oxoacyl-[acyl-carrier protein] reductase